MRFDQPIRVRPACEADAEAICEVLIRSIREVCGPDYGNDGDLLERWCRNKKPEIVRAWLGDPDSRTFVALDADARIVGAAQVARGVLNPSSHDAAAPPSAPETGLQSEDGGAGDFEVRLCYVLPEALRGGCGRALMGCLEEVARGLGASRLVLTSTSTARGFYERHGFRSSGPPEPRGPGWQFPMAKPL